MDKIVIILLVIICIFATIGLYSLITLIISIIFFTKKSKAVSYTWLNHLGCGQKSCKPIVQPLLYPNQISPNNYKKDIATYCADLVIRLDPKRTTSNKNDVKLPTDLSLKLKILNKPGDPLFGILCDGNKDNTAWLIYRGTANLQEWIQDFTYNQVTYKDWGLIHEGFWNIYNNNRANILSQLQKMNPKKVIVSGHSLGGGVAILTGVDLHLSGYDVEIYTFASPRVGNVDYCNKVNSVGPNIYRIVNTVDIVPTVPFGTVPNFNEYNKPWFYSDCGEVHPFTNNMKSIINNHVMANYSTNIPLK